MSFSSTPTSLTPTEEIVAPDADYRSPQHKEPYEVKVDAAQGALKSMSLSQGSSDYERTAKQKKGVDETASAVQSEDGQKALKLVGSFAEGLARRSEQLSELLDDAARIHPFIGVAVFAFKAALKLELTRRENDRRILGLHEQICDIMDTLLSARLLLKPEGDEGPVDELLKKRVSRLADDICRCAATCDSFKKASFFDRLRKGPEWNESLRGFVETFDGHYRFLNDTILVWTSTSVKDTSELSKATHDKVIEIKSYFEQSAAGFYWKAKGESNPDDRTLSPSAEMWEEVGFDHQGSVGDVVRSNAEVFARKFTLQKEALRRPPYHAMLPDVTKFWGDMGWAEGDQHRADMVVTELVKKFCESDSIPTMQTLLEAIDIDASSSITVAELKGFTRMAPRGWTLRLWLQYWMTGASVALRRVYDRIERLLERILASSLNIRVGNRAHIQRLLGEGVFLTTDYLLSGVYDSIQSIALDAKPYEPEFREYDDAEESRIRRVLEDLKYNLDAPNTLALVIQPGNIEKGIFLVLYHLLSECLNLIEKACSEQITKESMLQLRQSFWTLLQFIYERVNAICNMNVDSQTSHRERLISFASGMYRYTFYRNELGESNYMKRSRDEGKIRTPGTRYRPLEGRSAPYQGVPDALRSKIVSVTQDPSDKMYIFVSLCAAQGVSDIPLAERQPPERFKDMLKQAVQRATRRTTGGGPGEIPLPKPRYDQPLSAVISRRGSLAPGAEEWTIRDPEVFAQSLFSGMSPSEVEEYCWFVDLIVGRQVIHSPVRCDGCYAPTLIMTRITCLGCFGKDPSRTTDFCVKCIRQGDSMSCHRSEPHNPHPLLQLRQFTYNKWGNKYTDKALEALRGGGLRIRIGESPASESPRTCLACGCNLKRPFWRCLDCPETAYMCCQCNDDVERKLNFLVLEDIMPVNQYVGLTDPSSHPTTSRTMHHWSHSMVFMVPPVLPSRHDSSEVPSPQRSLLFGGPQRPRVRVHSPEQVSAPNPWNGPSALEDKRPPHTLLTPVTPGQSLPSSPLANPGLPTPLVSYGPTSRARRQFPRIQDTRYQSNPTPAELSSLSPQIQGAMQFSPVRPSPLRTTITRRKSLPTLLPSEEDGSVSLGPRPLPLEPPNLDVGSSPDTPIPPVPAPAPTFSEARAAGPPTQALVGVEANAVLGARVASLEMAFGNNLSNQIAHHASHLDKAQELIGSHLLRLEKLTTSLDAIGRTSPSPPQTDTSNTAVGPSNSVSTSSSAHEDAENVLHQRVASLEAQVERIVRNRRDSSLSTTAATPGMSTPELVLDSPTQEAVSPLDQVEAISAGDALPGGSSSSTTAPRGRFLRTARRLILFHRRSASTGLIHSRTDTS